MTGTKKIYLAALLLLALFAAFTVCVLCIDTAPIAPNGTNVGFSTVNQSVLDALGESSAAYTVSEVLGYLAIASTTVFFALALYQLIRRKSLKKIDHDLYGLFGLYVLMLACYVLFDTVAVVNYRPVAIDGVSTPSYPSSHTLLAVSIMSSSILQIFRRTSSVCIRTVGAILCSAVMGGVAICRLLAGVHWLTDIIGGILLAATLVGCYAAAVALLDSKKRQET